MERRNPSDFRVRMSWSLVCLCAAIPWLAAACTNPKEFSSAAHIGDLLTYSLDTQANSYSYEILESDFGLTGTRKSGALLSVGNYTYLPQDDPTMALMAFPNTLLVGHMTLPAQAEGVFFAGVPAREETHSIEDLVGAYNWVGYSCDLALVDGACASGYHSQFGTLRVQPDGTAGMCVSGNVDNQTDYPCQSLETLAWTATGTGLVEFTLADLPYATMMIYLAGGTEKVMAMARRNRPAGDYAGSNQGPGIVVGINKFEVPAAAVAGMYLGVESGVLFGANDFYARCLIRPDDTYALELSYASSPETIAYSSRGSLLLDVPWEGWIAQDDPNTVGYEQDHIALILPQSGVLFVGNPTVNTYFFAGGRLDVSCPDGDGDGYSAGSQCLLLSDCDDTNPGVNPGAEEICDNGIDDDCDGLVDAGDPDCFQTASNLPDTGITHCFDMDGWITCPDPGERFYGQDAQYLTNPMSYTAHLDGTVTDLVTGLVWQREDDHVGRLRPDAVVYCEDLTLAGQTDWRLPDRFELHGLVRYDRAGHPDPPMIDETYFPGTRVSEYWSSSISDSYMWSVDFRRGGLDATTSATLPRYVRCVRGEPTERSFTANGDGTVTDHATGLTWQQVSDDVSRDWEAALGTCENLTVAGRSDWRLPDVKELASIVDPSSRHPAIDPVFAGSTGAYWSSSVFPIMPTLPFWVDFSDGKVGPGFSWGLNLHVRCVRH